jgi:hypothetical protein
MVVVAKSSSIEGLTRTQIMPYWWTTVHWRDQYPLELYCRGDITMENVKLDTGPMNSWLTVQCGLPARKRDNLRQTHERKGLRITSKTLERRSAREQSGCSAKFATSTITTLTNASRIHSTRNLQQISWNWGAARGRMNRLDRKRRRSFGEGIWHACTVQ